MSNLKSTVVRVTEKENRLLKYLRRGGDAVVINVLNKAFTELKYNEDYLELKMIASLLEDRSFYDLETLIATNFLTQEQAEYLVEQMQANGNIIILGKTRTGKTSLLNALLYTQTNVNMKIIEKYNEIYIGEYLRDNKELNVNIETIETEQISASDIFVMPKNDKQRNRLVIGELCDEDSKCAVLAAMNLGIGVLTTCHDNVNIFKDKNQNKFLENIKNQNLTLVYLGIVEDNEKVKYKVSEIIKM